MLETYLITFLIQEKVNEIPVLPQVLHLPLQVRRYNYPGYIIKRPIESEGTSDQPIPTRRFYLPVIRDEAPAFNKKVP